MSVNSKFKKASEAAEGWLNTVGHIARFGKAGAVVQAYELLLPTTDHYNLHDSYCQHAEVLEQVTDKLAAFSDSPVEWKHGRGRSAVAHVPSAVFKHVWSSAHEAAVGIAGLALEYLVSADGKALPKKLLKNRWKVIDISMDEVATLSERIRRERAKLLALPEAVTVLTDADRYLLTVLDAHPGKPLTDRRICTLSVKMELKDREQCRRLSDSTIRKRRDVLETLGFVERPPGTKRQGIGITDSGRQALDLARANPTETQR